MTKENQEIVPHALVIAAKTFANKPRVIGEIVCALVGSTSEKNLSEVQKYILADCRAEITERLARRAKATERKRAQRARFRFGNVSDKTQGEY